MDAQSGASGFVGAVVARRLLADGHDVHLLVRPESDAWRLHGVDAPQHEVDLTDEPKLSTLLRSGGSSSRRGPEIRRSSLTVYSGLGKSGR